MKIRIVNKKKFIRMITVIVIILASVFIGLNKAYSIGETKYKQEYIVSGDTLWSLAEKEALENELYNNKDIRDIIQELKYINHLESNDLKIGQKILIPTY